MACNAAVVGGGGGEGGYGVGGVVDDGDAVAVEGGGEVDAVGVVCGGYEGCGGGCGEGGCEGGVEGGDGVVGVVVRVE